MGRIKVENTVQAGEPSPSQEGLLDQALVEAGRLVDANLGLEIDIDVEEMSLVVYPDDTPQTLGEQIYLKISAKVAAGLLKKGSQELISTLRGFRADMFQEDKSIGRAAADKVKKEIDLKIDTNFNEERDQEALGAVGRWWKGLRGKKHWDVLDSCIRDLTDDLGAYAGRRGVRINLSTTKGVPEVSPDSEDPFAIVYKRSPAHHKERHEAVHVVQLAQARVTILEQLLDRRRKFSNNPGSLTVQDLSPAELAEAEQRLDKLETEVSNYPAFELWATEIGGAGGRKIRKPSSYGDRLKKMTSAFADALSTPEPSLEYYRHAGASWAHRGSTALTGGVIGALAGGGLVAAAQAPALDVLVTGGLMAGVLGLMGAVGLDALLRTTPYISKSGASQVTFLGAAGAAGALSFALAGSLPAAAIALIAASPLALIPFLKAKNHFKVNV
jgi:hypothetical protein